MKFNLSVNINAPLDFVISIFLDHHQNHKWQDGYLSTKRISGEAWEEGSVSEMVYLMNNRKMIIKETILENNLPYDVLGHYYHKHTENTMHSFFTLEEDGTTTYAVEIEYTRFTGFMINIMKTLLPGLFKKQVLKWIKKFKTAVEEEYAS